MVNRHRGEISAELDGRQWTLCLTLGALAELENAYGDDDLLGLAERFDKGRLSARDVINILGAGLRGGGHDINNEIVEQMTAKGAAAGFIRIAVELLQVTFALEDHERGRP